jgi:hypothetical protein
MSPSSASKYKPSKKPAETGGKPVKAVTINIPVNRVTSRGEYRDARCSREGNSSRVTKGGMGENYFMRLLSVAPV